MTSFIFTHDSSQCEQVTFLFFSFFKVQTIGDCLYHLNWAHLFDSNIRVTWVGIQSGSLSNKWAQFLWIWNKNWFVDWLIEWLFSHLTNGVSGKWRRRFELARLQRHCCGSAEKAKRGIARSLWQMRSKDWTHNDRLLGCSEQSIKKLTFLVIKSEQSEINQPANFFSQTQA